MLCYCFPFLAFFSRALVFPSLPSSFYPSLSLSLSIYLFLFVSLSLPLHCSFWSFAWNTPSSSSSTLVFLSPYLQSFIEFFLSFSISRLTDCVYTQSVRNIKFKRKLFFFLCRHSGADKLCFLHTLVPYKTSIFNLLFNFARSTHVRTRSQWRIENDIFHNSVVRNFIAFNCIGLY